MDIKPLFITPLVYKEWDVNARINTIFINTLPPYFKSVILGSEKCNIKGGPNVLKPNENLFVRLLWKFLPRKATKDILDFPDLYYFSWLKNAFRYGSCYMRHNSVSYIHSISYPYSSHLVALELKKKYNVPWIAHFYEPWMDSPFLSNCRNNQIKSSDWELSVAKYADLIIHNSDEMCNSWQERYGEIVANKLFSLPMPMNFSKDREDYSTERNKDYIEICHIGNFYGLRKADVFLLSLKNVLKDNPSIRNHIKVNFVGRVSEEDMLLIKELGMEDIINITGVLTEEECVKYYKESDVFLVIESAYQGLLFFPSKVINYFYYNKPILGITLKGSVLYNQLVSNGYCAFAPSDITGIKDFILQAISNYKSLLDYNKNAWIKFDPKNVVECYESIINKSIKI